MKHFHLFVGGINSGRLEETMEAKWTSTGHETSKGHTGREEGRGGGNDQRKRCSPASPLQQRTDKTTRQRDLLEEERETLREALRQT